MIRAEHKTWAEFIFKGFVNRILKKNFNSMFQINDAPKLSSNVASIITPNHISWYDGFFIYYLYTHLWKKNKKLHLMMLEEQLRRYWFFKKVGAFSINPSNPTSSISTFKYIEELSKNPENIIVLYPQGKIEPYELTHLQPGLVYLVKKMQLNVDILPLHFRIQYSNQPRPDLYFRFEKTVTAHELQSHPHFYYEHFIKNRNLLAQHIFNGKTGTNWFGAKV